MNDPIVQLAEQSNENLSVAAAPGAFLVDLFPIRELLFSVHREFRVDDCTVRFVPSWLPGAGFQRTAERYRKTFHRVRNEPYEIVRQEIVSLKTNAFT